MKTKEEILESTLDSEGSIGSIFDAMEEYAMQFIPQWISVNDKLPEDRQDVMVYFSEPRNSIILCLWNEVFLEDNATHWMLIPEPPEV